MDRGGRGRALAGERLPRGRADVRGAGRYDGPTGHKSIALVPFDGCFTALDNHCPHQGGPLGEGSIENGLLRCPWHGYDYCPLDGKSPGFDDEATTYTLGFRVTERAALDDALAQAVADDGPAMVEVITDPNLV